MTLIAPPASWTALRNRHGEIADLLQRLWRLSTVDEQHHLLERLGDLIIDVENKQLENILEDAIADVHSAVDELRHATARLERMKIGRRS